MNTQTDPPTQHENPATPISNVSSEQCVPNDEQSPSKQPCAESEKQNKDSHAGDRKRSSAWSNESLPPSKKHQQRGIPAGLFGNYTGYYISRRLKGHVDDPRMALLPRSLITDKRVLDIGCNSGNLTILLAMKYKPSYILGVDIDERLIGTAKWNTNLAYSLRDPDSEDVHTDIGLRYHYFPKSMTTMFNVIDRLPIEKAPLGFPYNVEFKVEDWLKSITETNKYHTILALSITKWIHLHNGDNGIKEFFRKVYKSLKPGGVFVMEPQPFDTYSKRQKNAEHIKEVYETIEFKPDEFPEFLTTEVGFKRYEVAGEAENESKGFERTIYLFTK